MIEIRSHFSTLLLKTSEVLGSGVRRVALEKLRKSVLLLSSVTGIRDVQSFEVGDKASRFGETSEICPATISGCCSSRLPKF